MITNLRQVLYAFNSHRLTDADLLEVIESEPILIDSLAKLGHAALRVHRKATESCETCTYLYYNACSLKCKPTLGSKCNCYTRGLGD